MANYQKIPNNPGSGRDLLKSVPTAAAKPVGAEKVPSTQKELVKTIEKMLGELARSQHYNKVMGDSRQVDVILMRIASLLEAFKLNQSAEDLESAKKEILEKIESSSGSGLLDKVIAETIAKQITSIFEQPATKDDIEDLKAYLAEVAESTRASESKEAGAKSPTEIGASGEEEKEEETSKSEVPQEVKAKDEKEGNYANSTPAKNIFILQTFIGKQFETLNKNLKLVSSKPIFFPKFSDGISSSFKKIANKLSSIKIGFSKITKSASDKIANLTQSISKLAKFPFTALRDGIALVGKGIKSVGKVVGNLGTRVGNLITAPFKKFGSMISSLNPFNRKKTSKEKKAEKRQNSIFDSLEKLVKRLKKFADNIKVAVLDFIDSIIIPAAKIFAKGMSIILKPLLTFIWASGIGVLLTGIGAGLFLIGLAIFKLVDFVVDEIGPKIKEWMDVVTPDTVNNVLNSAANFMNTFSALMAALFAPLIAVGTVIMAAIEPIGRFIKEVLSSAVDHIVPIIDTIFGLIERTVVHILQAIEPIIHQIIDIVGGVIQTMLEAIAPIIEELKPLILVISDVICGVIKLTVMAIQAAIKGITDWWANVQKEGGLWPWFKNRLKAVLNFAKGVKDAIVEWWNSPDNPIKSLFNKLADMIWSLPVIGTFRPFGFLAGKDFFLSEAEEKEYKEVTSKRKAAQDIDKDIEALKERLAKGDTTVGRLDYGDGLAGYKHGTKLEDVIKDMEARRNKLNAEANAAAQKQMNLVEVDAQSKAQQAVATQMQPLNELEKSRAEENTMVNESFASVAKAEELEQKKQEEQQSWQSDQIYEMFQFLKDMRSEMKDGFANPQVVPAPVVITNNNGPNPAMMENR